MLVFSQFDYSAPIYNHLDKDPTDKLEKELMRAIRGRQNTSPRRHHALYACTSSILQAFKVVVNAHPSYLSEGFHYRLNVDLDLRRSDRCPPQPFKPPRRRTETYKHSFALKAMDLLNSIYFTDFTSTNVPLFKRILRDVLFSRDVIDWNARVRNKGLSSYLLYNLTTPTYSFCESRPRTHSVLISLLTGPPRTRSHVPLEIFVLFYHYSISFYTTATLRTVIFYLYFYLIIAPVIFFTRFIFLFFLVFLFLLFFIFVTFHTQLSKLHVFLR